MEKRYQVFVSSTYADLKEERQRVIQALMEMDCIPAGMELFPAADEEQWAFIKTIIDDCDYYLLIIGGRYGSTTSDGISYTEKEYDYAVARGIKVIGLLHEQPEEIPLKKSEADPELRQKLQDFRDKVAQNRLVKFWKTAEELPGLVALSLSKTIKTYPAVGWVRANHIASEDTLVEINQLRKENQELLQLVKQLDVQQDEEIDGLADMDSQYKIHGTYKETGDRISYNKTWESTISWKQIFGLISPYLLEHPTGDTVKKKLTASLEKRENLGGYSHSIDVQEFMTISIQLKAYGLVTIRYVKDTIGGMGLFWSLTGKGEQLMMKIRTVK